MGLGLENTTCIARSWWKAFPQLSSLILQNIRTIEGVVETTTLTAASEGL